MYHACSRCPWFVTTTTLRILLLYILVCIPPARLPSRFLSIKYIILLYIPRGTNNVLQVPKYLPADRMHVYYYYHYTTLPPFYYYYYYFFIYPPNAIYFNTFTFTLSRRTPSHGMPAYALQSTTGVYNIIKHTYRRRRHCAI